MEIVKRSRSVTKIQMKCFRCQASCLPKDGDWQDGEHNQVFVCKSCDRGLTPPRTSTFSRVPEAIRS